MFELYVSVAMLCATRRGARLSPATRARLYRIVSLVILAPGSVFVLWAAWPMVLQSVLQLETFPETLNPGYFVVKAAVALLAVLVLMQALRDGIGGSLSAPD